MTVKQLKEIVDYMSYILLGLLSCFIMTFASYGFYQHRKGDSRIQLIEIQINIDSNGEIQRSALYYIQYNISSKKRIAKYQTIEVNSEVFRDIINENPEIPIEFK